MGFFSAIRKIFTAPEQEAPKAEAPAKAGSADAAGESAQPSAPQSAQPAAQPAAQEAGRDEGRPAASQASAGGAPQANQDEAPASPEAPTKPASAPVPAEPAAEPAPEPAPGPAPEADVAKAPEPAPAPSPEPAPGPAPDLADVPADAPAASSSPVAPEAVPAAESVPAPASASAPAKAGAAATEAAQAPFAEPAPEAKADPELEPQPQPAPEAAPKRSVLASLFGFGRRQAKPGPEAPATPSPAPTPAAEARPAESPAGPAEPKPEEQAAPAPAPDAGTAPAGESLAAQNASSASLGGWALFEAAPAPEQEPVFAEPSGVAPGPQPAATSPVQGQLQGQPQGPVQTQTRPAQASADAELTVRLRKAEPRLSAWLDVILDGVAEAGPLLESRVRFLLESLEAPAAEIDLFLADFAGWLARMEYHALDEFRSELQYRLAIALDLEDEEDERSRLFVKLTESLAKTRAEFARRLDGLFASHGNLNDEFWEELEELFIMADLGYEAAVGLVERLRERCREEGVTTSEGVREALKREIKAIFAQPKRIAKVNPPEIVLMIGVNGAGKTTTIAKLAYRDRMQGRKVMIAAADTFRAAAIDQMRVWAERVGTLFHAKQPGSDPASVAFEAVDRALKEGVDVLYVDTAGRLQTKVNLMDELAKIRQVIARKHPGAPHRTVLVLDATTGQNALSQARLFKESAGVDELILTKLDGTAKGGVAIAVALQQGLPITYVGLGEKVEDLRPFNGDDYADALLASV